MAFDVRVPVVGESVQEGEIYRWHKNSGDFVKQDDVLLELETDKATVEIVSEASGVLEVLVKDGSTVKVGDIVARIDTDAKGPSAPKAAAKEAKPATPEAAPAPVTSTAKKSAPSMPPSPAASRMIEEEGLDSGKIAATGKGGRITKEDVVNFKEGKAVPQAPVAKSVPAVPATTSVVSGERSSRREKMSRLRQRIAERLVQAQHDAAMLTTFNEIDMSGVMATRAKYKDAFKDKNGVNLGFMSFFVKAAVEALKAVPGVNAYIDGTDIVYNDFYDIGIAVSTDKGLIVPVVRDCDKLSFAGVEKAIGDYAVKGRDGKINLDDLSGGTFTITNGGVFGSLLSTPILNPPQSAILGMHKIEQRAVVVNNEIVIRPMMYVALSYDHRIVDGKEAVGFLVKIKEFIEDPARLLLGV